MNNFVYDTSPLAATTTGRTENRKAIVVKKAVGTVPLYRVQYTSQKGNTNTYGVFWSGPDRKDPSRLRLGLRPLLKSGIRMHRPNRHNTMSKGFFVFADECKAPAS